MPFAQLVIGPPGAGKSTYCDGMHQFMSAIGRQCSVVNLDPANDRTTYPCALDVRDFVTIEEIMEDDALGPNGAVLYALEELERNFDWLKDGLKELGEDYILFDCPGQVEIFTHHSSLRNIFFKISKLGYRLIVVHLVDSYSLTLPSMYISVLLLSLRAMLQMDLPHINVLTKIDNLSNYAPLPFKLDFYTEVQDLKYLLPYLEEETSRLSHKKFGALNNAICELVQEFGLVAFETLAVEDKKSMTHLLQVIDRASGYAFGPAEGANDTVWQVAMREGWGDLSIQDVQERWIDAKEEYDEYERRQMEEEAKKTAPDKPHDEDEDDNPKSFRNQSSSSSSMTSSSSSSTTKSAAALLLLPPSPGTSPRPKLRASPRPSSSPRSAIIFLVRRISLLALRIASSSAFRIVPETLSTRNTHGVPTSAPEGEGIRSINDKAAHTIRNAARGHRIIAVDVAGEKYLTPNPPVPNLPTPQSPKFTAISSRMSFARSAGVKWFGEGAWIATCAGISAVRAAILEKCGLPLG